MKAETFIERLAGRGLWLEVVDASAQKLAVLGETASLTDAIRKYIRENKPELIALLLATSAQESGEQVPATSAQTNEPICCTACQQPVAEHDERTWRIGPAPEAWLFCTACYERRNIALLLPGEEIEQAMFSMESRACEGCGSTDWLVDPWLTETDPDQRRTSGFLICPCLIDLRAKNERLDKERQRARLKLQMPVSTTRTLTRPYPGKKRPA